MTRYFPILFLLALTTCQPQKQEQNNNPAEESAVGYWYRQPLRILQTVLRQPDAANYNVDSLVMYMKGVHANVLVINGGGIVDYFRNTLPMANINPYIGKRDLLADIVKGCHDAGIKVIARVDFRGVEKERYEKHPDWFAKDESGKPVILDYTTPELYAPCYNGYYRNEHAVEFISYLFENYHIDGIWHNSVNFHQVCYCTRCRKLFSDEYHKKIPVKGSPENEWEVYYTWNSKMANHQLALMRATVKKYGADKSYAAEVFDMYSVEQQKHTGISLYSAADYFDFLVTVSFIANNTANVEYKDICYPAAITKFLKALEPEKSPVILFGGNGTEHRYIYDPLLDSRLWLWEAAAAGGGFWNCYFNGSFPANTFDRRNAYMASNAYNYIRNNEKLIRGLQPVTDVAVFYSLASGHMLGDDNFSLPVKGLIRLLEEGHYQYGFIADRNLTKEKLNGCKVLIMPNVAALSEEHTSIIAGWVKEGGRLMATFQTSLFDRNGNIRKNFSLGDVFGVSYTGVVANTEMDCYQKIITRNKILDGFEKTRLLHNGGRTLMVSPAPEATVVTGYLPKINNQPPEYAYPASWESGNPIVVTRNFGEGKVVYFANEPDKLNYTIGHPDYNQLLKNSINTLLGEVEILKTNTPASVHVYLNRSSAEPGVYQLSLVNTTAGSRRPFRDLVPVSGISIQLPFIISSYTPLLEEKKTRVKIRRNTLYIEKLDEFYALKLQVKEISDE
ncbi:MAG: beta-galactosidase trimerization domain-containing protein [Bacteroidales bacterium]|nr:beta-galactosidase trimerization domain-containing protein [Bacteroidales bacterium]